MSTPEQPGTAVVETAPQAVDLALLVKIHQLMGKVGYLQNDAFNKFHKYNYLSDKKIKTEVHAALVEFGLWLQTDDEELELIPWSNNEGKPQWMAKVKIRYTLHDVDTGASVSGHYFGIGTDTGDKCLYKADTGGSKYLWRKLLQIASGDDPENEAGSTENAQAVAQKKLEKMKASIERTGDKIDLSKMIASITGMKEKLRQVHPLGTQKGEDLYYETLAKFGVKHGNDKKFMSDIEAAKKCWKALAQAVADSKSMTAAGEQMGLQPEDANPVAADAGVSG